MFGLTIYGDIRKKTAYTTVCDIVETPCMYPIWQGIAQNDERGNLTEERV